MSSVRVVLPVPRVRRRTWGLLAATTAVVLVAAGTAQADQLSLDGDTASNGQGALVFGGSGNACDEPVAGAITVGYAGSNHFIAGEPLTVTLSGPAGTSTVVTDDTPRVPDTWNGNQDSFTIPIQTTVGAVNASGKVYVTVAGASYSVGKDGDSDRPQFPISVACGSTSGGGGASDPTPPSISISHTVTGLGGWNTNDPVTVDVSVSDDVAVTSVSCTDNAGAPFPVTDPFTSFTVTGEGIHQLSCTASDGTNTSEPATDTVKIDTVDPALTYVGASPAASGTDADGLAWRKSDVTLTWSCTDVAPGSGVAAGWSATDLIGDQARGITRTKTCDDVAGNSSSSTDPSPAINLDETAPSLMVNGVDSGTFDVCHVPARPSFSLSDPALNSTDAGSGVDPATVSESWTVPPVFGLGTSTYSASADDYATNHAQEGRTYTASTYGSAFSGFLQPINLDGRSRFKLGSTIPVKFRLMCGTTPITNAVVTLRLTKMDNAADAGDNEAVSTAAATEGNLFRYDTSGQQYIFNLNTKVPYKNPDGTLVNPAPGSWTVIAALGDGTTQRISFQIYK